MELKLKLNRFLQGDKLTHDSIFLNHRCIFILPTKRGLGFVLLIVILLLIAFVYNNNLAYLLSFLLASIFFITILHSFKSLTSLRIFASPKTSVFAGEAAGFTVTIKNPNNIERFNLLLSLEDNTLFSLKKQQQKQLTLYSKTDKRGWYTLKKITLSSTYPLGFFRAWSPLYFNSKILIYPKPSNTQQPFPETAGQQEQALINSNSKGNDDFYGLKEYQAGDPIKHIHWKAFAKNQGLFSKQYENDCCSDLWLNYAQTSGHHVEDRLSQLCRWLIDAETAGMHYGFSLPGFKLETGYGKQHYEKCLEAMALF
jgi:uncharacterized protein (DUF58 family)